MVAGLVVACGKSTFRSGEGQHCSSNSSEDPHYTCSPAYDLVCITTYNAPVSGRPVYVCRLTCAKGCNPGEVCCPGKIYGKTYDDKMSACVLARDCETADAGGTSKTDGGAGGARDGGASDGGASDGAVDSPPADGADDAADSSSDAGEDSSGDTTKD